MKLMKNLILLPERCEVQLRATSNLYHFHVSFEVFPVVIVKVLALHYSAL